MTIGFQHYKKIECNICGKAKEHCKSVKDFEGWLTIRYGETTFGEQDNFTTFRIEACPECRKAFLRFRNNNVP